MSVFRGSLIRCSSSPDAPFIDIYDRVKYETSGSPSLYSRQWYRYTNTPSQCSIRVMQFNILAEGLSASPQNTPPFSVTLDGSPIQASDYGGFDIDNNADDIFDFNKHRRWKLLQEIFRVSPDILALEECDHFADFFEPALAAAGYEGIFQPKDNSPCCKFGYYSDGVALFWRSSVLSLIQDPSDPQKPQFVYAAAGPCAHVVVTLQHSSGSRITVGATHLKAKAGDALEALREQQIAQVLDTLELLGAQSSASHAILMGDFNAEPYDTDRNAAMAVPLALEWRDGALRSAYCLPTEPGSDQYTTWKSREGTCARRVIDYILHTQGMRVSGVLAPPAVDEISQSTYKLPDMRYPSDHLAIAADLELLER